jgi:energy-coupling factor transporter transmembrane protein EcfT
VASGTVGVLLARSLQLSTEVHVAMRSRGFQGEVHLLEDPAIHPSDWLHLLGFAAFSAAALVVGR